MMIGGELTSFGRLIHCIQSGWHNGQHSHALGDQQSAQLWNVESWHQYERCAQTQAWIESNIQTIYVVERQKAKHDVIVAQVRSMRCDDLKHIGHEVEV